MLADRDRVVAAIEATRREDERFLLRLEVCCSARCCSRSASARRTRCTARAAGSQAPHQHAGILGSVGEGIVTIDRDGRSSTPTPRRSAIGRGDGPGLRVAAARTRPRSATLADGRTRRSTSSPDRARTAPRRSIDYTVTPLREGERDRRARRSSSATSPSARGRERRTAAEHAAGRVLAEATTSPTPRPPRPRRLRGTGLGVRRGLAASTAASCGWSRCGRRTRRLLAAIRAVGDDHDDVRAGQGPRRRGVGGSARRSGSPDVTSDERLRGREAPPRLRVPHAASRSRS